MNDDGARSRSAAGSVDGAEPAGGGQDLVRRTNDINPETEDADWKPEIGWTIFWRAIPRFREVRRG